MAIAPSPCPPWAWQIAQASASAASALGLPGEPQEPRHHLLHLLLARVPVPDDRLLDLERGVLGHRQLRRDGGADRRPARLAERERGRGVDVHEHLLERHLGGAVGRDHLGQRGEDDGDALGEALDPRGADAAARHVDEPRPFPVDDAETGGAESWIDAEDPHCRHGCANPEGALVETNMDAKSSAPRPLVKGGRAPVSKGEAPAGGPGASDGRDYSIAAVV